VLLVLLDLSAAFDTIDHEILLKRLHDIAGVEGSALKWMRSYLTGRFQKVIIEDCESKSVPLQVGVPQGSVLGPLLFLAYILPLRHLIRKFGVSYHGYADDTQLYIECDPKSTDSLKASLETLEDCIRDVKRAPL
jgi:retron-type reverse transcriptase